MMHRLRWPAVLVVLVLPLTELGHTVAYGASVPSAGAHAYFPTVLHLAGSALGVLLLGALGVLVLARIVAGPVPRRRPWSFAALFTFLFALQLAVFLVQEGLEARAQPGLHTVAAGILGQQPVALAAALALRWLSARLGPAAAALRSPWRPEVALLVVIPALAPAASAPVALRPLRLVPASAPRGPPL